MKDILKAEVYKLKKSHSFRYIYALLTIHAILSIFVAIIYKDVTGFEILVNHLKNGVPMLFVIIFIANFFSLDFKEKTIKNIICKNFNRKKLFFSKYIVCLVSSYVMLFSTYIVYLLCISIMYGFGAKTMYANGEVVHILFIQSVVIMAQITITFCVTMTTKSFGISVAICGIILKYLNVLVDTFSSFINIKIYIYRDT